MIAWFIYPIYTRQTLNIIRLGSLLPKPILISLLFVCLMIVVIFCAVRHSRIYLCKLLINQSSKVAQTKQYPEPKHIRLKLRPKPYFHGKSYSYLLIVLCLFATLGVWIMQNSINAYYLQTYHKSSPLSLLDRYPAWKMGGDIGNKLYAWHGDLTSAINQKNQQIVDYFNDNLAYTPQYQAMMAKKP